jgi:hypothetical protein
MIHCVISIHHKLLPVDLSVNRDLAKTTSRIFSTQDHTKGNEDMKRNSKTTNHAVARSQTMTTAWSAALTNADLSQVRAGGGPQLPDGDPPPGTTDPEPPK